MTDTPLQRAIDALSIRDVFIVQSESWLADEFEPQYSPGIEHMEVAWKHNVMQSQVATLEADTGETQLLFRVMVELGMRLNIPASSNGTSLPEVPDKAADEPLVCACVEARFVAEYAMQEDFEEEAKRAFALNNASYHIWPYWREYLMSQCTRMNLPKVTVPAVQFSRNAERDARSRN
ncbi:hypothetical protein RM531_15715 [Salinisphaera sp. P385]|uniref:Preprotein translocase subunit SecB n=1 Tax=Spectribacter acetivorans TaxID=3075603 RepID=A0ABU3BBS6_9GAMM|nr:hypothetical protein [Salinisphaera sp. P385]MDT0619915.1 hypothetical protein [Salinisphaera sp. P385]